MSLLETGLSISQTVSTYQGIMTYWLLTIPFTGIWTLFLAHISKTGII